MLFFKLYTQKIKLKYLSYHCLRITFPFLFLFSFALAFSVFIHSGELSHHQYKKSNFPFSECVGVGASHWPWRFIFCSFSFLFTSPLNLNVSLTTLLVLLVPHPTLESNFLHKILFQYWSEVGQCRFHWFFSLKVS